MTSEEKRIREREKVWAKYGIRHLGEPLRWEDYTSQMKRQHYRCPICGTDLRIRRAHAAADHAHTLKDGSGPFRAVLCWKDNRSLGTYERTGKCGEAYLRKLLDAYIRKYGGGH